MSSRQPEVLHLNRLILVNARDADHFTSTLMVATLCERLGEVADELRVAGDATLGRSLRDWANAAKLTLDEQTSKSGNTIWALRAA